MHNDEHDEGEPLADRLVTADEVAQLLAVSSRTVLMLPIRQVRVGTRLVRYRLGDVYEYLGIDNPNF